MHVVHPSSPCTPQTSKPRKTLAASTTLNASILHSEASAPPSAWSTLVISLELLRVPSAIWTRRRLYPDAIARAGTEGFPLHVAWVIRSLSTMAINTAFSGASRGSH